MKKILVAYHSLTGNTQRVAEAIYHALPPPKEIARIEDVSSLDGFGLLFIGFPVHSHSVPAAVDSFLRRIPERASVALFSTHGSFSGGKLSREAIEYASTLVSRARLLGTFSCRGKVSLPALEVLKKSPEHAAWTEMAPSASTHPDRADLEDAQAFARWVLTLYRQHQAA